MAGFITRQINSLLAQLPVAVRIVMPDGKPLGSPDKKAQIVLRLKNATTLTHFAGGQIGLIACDYVEGKLEIDGTMRDLMSAAAALLGATGSDNPIAAPKVQWLSNIVHHVKSTLHHTKALDAEQIQFHYDVSDEFYALWLDPKRAYSCAYYHGPNLTLAQAQEAKLDHICRKLNLQPDEEFLDLGAGWGALLLWAAKRYQVKATGITLSKNQWAYVNRLIEEKGLQDRVRMLLCDYRELKTASFDKIASVGMFEHVGRAHMADYFAILHKLLKPGGIFINHGITSAGTKNHRVGQNMGEFIGRYIFPGGELIHISDELRAMSEAKLEPLDAENLRPHYAKTLWAWSDALESQLDEARRLVDDKVLRAYRLYLAGCAMCFERSWISLFQVLGSRPDNQIEVDGSKMMLRGAQSCYPFTRQYMYPSSKFS